MKSSPFSLGLLFALACSGWASAADAQPEPAGPTRPAAAHSQDFREVAVVAYPLSALIGRYSLQLEYMLSPHHGLVLNPHLDSVGSTETVSVSETDVNTGQKTTGAKDVTYRTRGGGVELGYRFFSGKRGMTGFYAGPSLLLNAYSQSGKCSGSLCSGDPASVSFFSYGLAVDVGGQAIVGDHLVIGGGIGLQYVQTSEPVNASDDASLATKIVTGEGVRPRFLFGIGYAF